MNIFSKIFNKKHNSNCNLGYRIIPLGTYCLPRVISTISMLKPTKAAGEKTMPFDLGFFWSIDGIIDMLDSEFKTFYKDLKFGQLEDNNTKRDLKILFNFNANLNHWVNDNLKAVFNHEFMLSEEEFKSRYDRRIKALYEYIKDTGYEVYFLIASFSEISLKQINRLKKVINKYRPQDTYNIIIINQCSHSYKINQKRVYVIDATGDDFEKFLKANNTNWVAGLKLRNNFPNAQKFYDNITTNLKKIIFKM